MKVSQNPLYSIELQNSNHIAGNRLDIADFLCLSVWDSKGINSLIFFSKNIGAVRSTRKDLRLVYVSVFEAPSHFLIQKLNTHRTMNNLDLTAYLVDVYLESERLFHPVEGKFDPDKFIKSLEIWWTRQKQSETPISATNTHLALALINIVQTLVGEMLHGVDCKLQHLRLSELKSEIVHFMGSYLPQEPKEKEAA